MLEKRPHFVHFYLFKHSRNTRHYRSIHQHHRLHISTYHPLPTMDVDVYFPAVWSLGRCFSCWRWDIMSLPIDHWPAEIVLPVVEGQPSTEAIPDGTPRDPINAKRREVHILRYVTRLASDSIMGADVYVPATWLLCWCDPCWSCDFVSRPLPITVPLTRLPPPHSKLSVMVQYIPFWGYLHPSHSNRYVYRNERCR